MELPRWPWNPVITRMMAAPMPRKDCCRRGVRPDGVFCANDMMALGFMDVARSQFGMRIPEDLRIAGFDNSSLASWPTYELSSVDQSMDEMVRLAVEEVSGRLSGQDSSSRHIEVPGELCLRRSTLG